MLKRVCLYGALSFSSNIDSFGFVSKLGRNTSNFLRMKKTLLLSSLIFPFSLIAAPTGGDSDYSPSPDATHTAAMILVNDGDVNEVIQDLESQGVTVLRHRNNILLTFIPVELAESDKTESGSSLRRAKGVKRIEYSRPKTNRPLMSNARQFNQADLISSGRGLPQPYDGSGVVVGVCDIGMDTRHPNFLDKDQRNCRIKRVVHYKEHYGSRDVFSTPEEIYDWETDNRDEWHATHVVGIAAGAHTGSNYQGLATGADIVFTASQLSDVGLLAGVEDIIDYAREVGKPAVINLSMGNYLGPHDGSSLFCRYIDMCAEDAIICLSAGNEGDNTNGMIRSMSHDFTENEPTIGVRTTDWAGLDTTGETEVWSADDSPFRFSLKLYCGTGAEGDRLIFDKIEFTDDSPTSYRVSADPNDPDYNEDFASVYYEGYVEITGGRSILNGRYYVNMRNEFKCDQYFPGYAWANYWPGIIVEAEPGVHADIYCDGGSFLRQDSKYRVPDNKMNISDLATAHKIISVGMKNNIDFVENAVPGSGNSIEDVNINSSYGTLADGRKLPLTVAPGGMVVSSISSAYIEDHPEEVKNVVLGMDYRGNNVYWTYNIGTSMSCPFVVGAIATWLQAYPLLTSEEAMEIVGQTNQKSGFPDPGNPRHGQGWFNAYAGLGKVLNLAALKVGTIDAPEFVVRTEGRNLIIGNPGEYTLEVNIYGMGGLLMRKETVSASTGAITLSDLAKGVYLVNVRSASGKSETVKVAF